jgi:hypothetical protein
MTIVVLTYGITFSEIIMGLPRKLCFHLFFLPLNLAVKQAEFSIEAVITVKKIILFFFKKKTSSRRIENLKLKEMAFSSKTTCCVASLNSKFLTRKVLRIPFFGRRPFLLSFFTMKIMIKSNYSLIKVKFLYRTILKTLYFKYQPKTSVNIITRKAN